MSFLKTSQYTGTSDTTKSTIAEAIPHFLPVIVELTARLNLFVILTIPRSSNNTATATSFYQIFVVTQALSTSVQTVQGQTKGMGIIPITLTTALTLGAGTYVVTPQWFTDNKAALTISADSSFPSANLTVMVMD